MAKVNGLLGKKLGMTQVFTDDGESVPVTVLQAGPCEVLQVKGEKEGYTAAQLGFDDRMSPTQWEQIKTWWEKGGKNRSGDDRRRNWKGVTSAEMGHLKASGAIPKHFVKEVPVAADDGDEGLKAGDTVTVAIFKETKKVDVSGRTKGRGFTGTIKRHGFARGPKTHGSKNYREPGSIGMAATPSRVLKGKRMAGQYGNSNQTRRNLEVVRVDEERNVLLVKGGVPGPNGGYVLIRPAIEER